MSFLDDAIGIEYDYDAGCHWAYEGVHRAADPFLVNFKDLHILDLQKAKLHAGRGRGEVTFSALKRRTDREGEFGA